MKKYRKKPVVIDAVQITDNTFDAPHPNPEHIKCPPEHTNCVHYDPVRRCVWIRTREGEMRGNIGDWIIRGVKGEYYPCKPDIFEATYEPAE